MDKTVYISDLDGTLLQSDQTLSPYTLEVINGFIAKGGLFAYATARSLITAKPVTKGLRGHNLSIIYNGAFIVEQESGDPVVANFHTPEDVAYIRQVLEYCDVEPITFAYLDEVERFSFRRNRVNAGMGRFLEERLHDVRRREVGNTEQLYAGNLFNFTCIGEEAAIVGACGRLQERTSLNCIYQRDVYTSDPWMDILPAKSSKAKAVLQLKELYGCDRVVCFGDGMNDISMFQVADACYAMENAVPQLKAIATGVIEGNNQDGVAKWIAQYGQVSNK